MEAPDKIYLYREKSKDYFDEDWHESPASDVKNIAYIHKDALLEWLESKVYEHNEDRFDDGFNTALGQVIDKLNSM